MVASTMQRRFNEGASRRGWKQDSSRSARKWAHQLDLCARTSRQEVGADCRRGGCAEARSAVARAAVGSKPGARGNGHDSRNWHELDAGGLVPRSRRRRRRAFGAGAPRGCRGSGSSCGERSTHRASQSGITFKCHPGAEGHGQDENQRAQERQDKVEEEEEEGEEKVEKEERIEFRHKPLEVQSQQQQQQQWERKQRFRCTPAAYKGKTRAVDYEDVHSLDAQKFKRKGELMAYASKHPGALSAHFLASIFARLSKGRLTKSSQLREANVVAWASQHSGLTEIRDVREVLTLSEAMDSINRKEISRAMDILAQRILAIQCAKRKGGSWEKAEAIELIPSGTSLASSSMLALTN